MSAFLKEAGQKKSPVMTGMSIQGQETQSLWSDSIINVMCKQTHFFCSCGRWMGRVWERRERSLTEPRWDNEGRADKAAWGRSKAEGSPRLNFKWHFSPTRDDRLIISKKLPSRHYLISSFSLMLECVVDVWFHWLNRHSKFWKNK